MKMNVCVKENMTNKPGKVEKALPGLFLWLCGFQRVLFSSRIFASPPLPVSL